MDRENWLKTLKQNDEVIQVKRGQNTIEKIVMINEDSNSAKFHISSGYANDYNGVFQYSYDCTPEMFIHNPNIDINEEIKQITNEFKEFKEKESNKYCMKDPSFCGGICIDKSLLIRCQYYKG